MNFEYISLILFLKFVMVSTIVENNLQYWKSFQFSLFFQVNQEMFLPLSEQKCFICKSSLALKMWVVAYLSIWDNKTHVSLPQKGRCNIT